MQSDQSDADFAISETLTAEAEDQSISWRKSMSAINTVLCIDCSGSMEVPSGDATSLQNGVNYVDATSGGNVSEDPSNQ